MRTAENELTVFIIDVDPAGTASVTMGPRDNPWGSAVLPTPHITEH
jgi:hypothetical protein